MAIAKNSTALSRRKKMRTTLAIWLMAALLVGTTTIPAVAFPNGRAIHAMRCVGPLEFSASNGQMYNASPTTIQVLCPVESDTEVNFKEQRPTVYGFTNGSTWEGKACYTFASGGGVGGHCGDPLTTVGSGRVEMTLKLNGWADALSTDYPYLVITLGGPVGASYNVIFGWLLG
jgi:hypothetical protein